MTTLLSWTGIDTHGPASIYIASDSRISWGAKKTWDLGRKVFASRNEPEIFGYCGSVAFPIQILSQIVDLIDNGYYCIRNMPYEEKLEILRKEIERSYFSLPALQRGDCEILYATRVRDKMKSSFHAAKIIINKSSVSAEDIELPERSGIIACSGSGRSSLNSSYRMWIDEKHKEGNSRIRTSRSVFSSFCLSLKSQEDPFSGGAPQLAGVYRVGSAKNFGVIYNGKRFFGGLEISPEASMNDHVEWRNELFERCCGRSLEKLKSAQPQPEPNWIKNKV